MKAQTKKHTILILLSLLLSISIYIIPQVIAPAVNPTIDTIKESTQNMNTFTTSNNQNNPLLLIILSPQYQNDTQILNAIKNYQYAIYEQPGWFSQIHKLVDKTNTISDIDSIIEQYAEKYDLTSVLLIGEDIHLPKKTEYNDIIKPDITPYATIDHQSTDKQVCISLLHPHPADSYQQKQSDLIKTINRFTQKRTLKINSESTIIEQKDLSFYSSDDYKKIANSYNASYQEEITTEKFNALFQKQYGFICLHGHGQPHQLILNSTTNLKISSTLLSKINVQLLTLDGCYTDSMYTNQNDSRTTFISSICKSNTLHIAFFGLLSQQTSAIQENVINSILPNLSNNQTIAETINTAQVSFNFMFAGDPTIQIIL